MRVWLAWVQWPQDEGPSLVGVYTTRERAEIGRAAEIQKWESWGYTSWVDEWEVQG